MQSRMLHDDFKVKAHGGGRPGRHCKREDANRTIAAAVDNFGRIDILANNAQTSKQGKIEDITDEGLLWPSDRAFTAPFIICRRRFPF